MLRSINTSQANENDEIYTYDAHACTLLETFIHSLLCIDGWNPYRTHEIHKPFFNPGPLSPKRQLKKRKYVSTISQNFWNIPIDH